MFLYFFEMRVGLAFFVRRCRVCLGCLVRIFIEEELGLFVGRVNNIIWVGVLF